MPEERPFQNSRACYSANNHEKASSTLLPALHAPGGNNGPGRSRRHILRSQPFPDARLEKEGDYKAALESGKKAAELLQSLKSSTPEWNPEWVAGKLDAAAQLQQRVEPLAQKAGESKKADYSLKPGERRDFTLQRAYKAHEQQKLIVGAVPAPAPVHGAEPGKSAAPAASGRTEIRVVTPAAARPTVVSRRSAPSRGLPPRTDRDGRFRIGS